MKTVFDIIDTVLVRGYFGEDVHIEPEILLKNPHLGLKYDRFTQILCDPKNPIYSSRRTIRQKWKFLHELGYLVFVNQHASRINVEKIYEDFYKM